MALNLPNGNRFSRAQGMPTNQDDDHAKYLSQKARVSASAGNGWCDPFARNCTTKWYKG